MVSIPAESDMFVFKKNPFVGTNLQKKKLSLNESGIVKNIHLDERDDGYGRYIVGDSIDEKTGGTGKFLIELKDYSVQEALLLVDHKVKFHLRSNGSKLKPLDLQFPEVFELITSFRAKTELNLNLEEIDESENNVEKTNSLDDQDEPIVATVTMSANNKDFIKKGSCKGTAIGGTPLEKATTAHKEILDNGEVYLEDTESILENLVASAAQKCSDLGLPMFMSVCIPSSKKYKK